MGQIIITIILILITVYLLKDTHIKVYNNRGGYYTELQEEYDFKLPVWMLLFIILIYLVPVMNIIIFIIFSIYYAVHAIWDPKYCDGETHVFSLNGNNWITKGLLAIKEILNKEIK